MSKFFLNCTDEFRYHTKRRNVVRRPIATVSSADRIALEITKNVKQAEMKMLAFPESARPQNITGGKPMSREGQTTLMAEAYARLEEMIVTLELSPGAVVSEAILSRQLDIGTTPIREALHRLSREYLVQIIPRRGVVVTSIDVRLQFEVLETRRELDRLLASAAARRASDSDKAAIAALIGPTEDTAAAQDIREFLRMDAQLNVLLSQAARNAVAADTVARLHSVSRRFWYFHLDVPRHLAETARYHLDVVKAVAVGDPGKAAGASDQLVDYLVEFSRQTLPHA
ncbi:GntR family transcriptional regulator [Pseudomonas sp.]|uniref:GntR family transcriptional regulator n=1 Tax=Pseudomonas sp. TaxID=306 RepID=UPI0025E83583|nr:GntR family transcriptional regulator [Pseudomonas sp.]